MNERKWANQFPIWRLDEPSPYKFYKPYFRAHWLITQPSPFYFFLDKQQFFSSDSIGALSNLTERHDFDFPDDATPSWNSGRDSRYFVSEQRGGGGGRGGRGCWIPCCLYHRYLLRPSIGIRQEQENRSEKRREIAIGVTSRSNREYRVQKTRRERCHVSFATKSSSRSKNNTLSDNSSTQAQGRKEGRKEGSRT
jgi:hypothetical protein